MKTNNMNFSQNPSAIYTLWKAFNSRNNTYVPGREYRVIHASRTGFKINKSHLDDFHSICGVRQSDVLHILYPFTLVYPYIMRVLSAKEMPISLFRVLNTRNSMIMHRPIKPDERLDIDCHNSAPRILDKGLELDVISAISSGGEKVWENTTTYFFPGKFGPADESFRAPMIEPIKNAPALTEWFLPAKDRFRFARISGDTNGIHYWFYYARMMGFKRDFAQPIRIVAKCVSSLPDTGRNGQTRLEFHLKGPVYYNSTLTLKNLQSDNTSRFDLMCSGNNKPVIRGILHHSR